MNRAAAAIFLAVLCSACPKRIEFGPEGELTDAQAVYQRVRENQDNIVSLEGDSKLRVESPQASGTLSMFVSITRPALLHLETFDFFNRPLASLVSDGKRFGLYQTETNTWYQGPASPENVSRFLPVVLPGEELVAIMLGQVPLIPPEQMTLKLDRDQGVYVLTLQRGAATQVLHVHTKYLRVMRSQVRGIPGYDLSFADFLEKGSLIFPGRVELVAEQAQTKLQVRYQQISLNGRPDLTLYELVAPEGAKVVEVDDRGRELPPGAPAPSGPPVSAQPPAVPGS
jgi:outer membrane lipoprotein-sorting protein